MIAVTFLLLFALGSDARAVTRHVPVDYPTIQSALDVLSENDTVLVDTGLYEEALLAPSIDFVLRGNVMPDTGVYPRPVIDPSFLPNPTHLSCFRQDSASVVIEDIWFRNRWPMHPSASDTGGGVFHPHGTITVRRCMFDSTYHSIVAFYADMTMEHCMFWNMSGYGPLSWQRAEATDCSFKSDTTRWAQFTGGDGTRIERCQFSGHYGNANTLFLSGDIRVSDCVFGPGIAQWMDRLHISSCTNLVFENNVLENWTLGSVMFGLSMSAPGSVIIRNNTMRDCENPTSTIGGFELRQVQTCDTCVLVFEENVIENCHGQTGVPGAAVMSGRGTFRHNRFVDLSPLAAWNAGAQWTLRDNLFYGNSYALNSLFAPTDAIWNWWGDSTGPRCAQNPSGQGDSIVGNIIFDPWYTDTTFFAEAAPPARQRPFPVDYSLTVYPNPFNPVASLEFGLPKAGRVIVNVFNITGRRVCELLNRRYEAGTHAVTFDAQDLPTGIYFARIEVTPLGSPAGRGRWSQTEKMVLLK